jgi:hypothetical protein
MRVDQNVHTRLMEAILRLYGDQPQLGTINLRPTSQSIQTLCPCNDRQKPKKTNSRTTYQTPTQRRRNIFPRQQSGEYPVAVFRQIERHTPGPHLQGTATRGTTHKSFNPATQMSVGLRTLPVQTPLFRGQLPLHEEDHKRTASIGRPVGFCAKPVLTSHKAVNQDIQRCRGAKTMA